MSVTSEVDVEYNCWLVKRVRWEDKGVVGRQCRGGDGVVMPLSVYRSRYWYYY